MYVHHLGLYCVLFRRVLIYKIDVALQLTKLWLKKLPLLPFTDGRPIGKRHIKCDKPAESLVFDLQNSKSLFAAAVWVQWESLYAHLLAGLQHSMFQRLKREREREQKLFTTEQIINVTIKLILCGRLPGRKFPSSWPPMLIQMYIIL